jgi:hypothetical protein
MKALMAQWLQVARSNPRIFVWLGASMGLLCLLDFVFRVHVPRDDDLRRFSAPAVVVLPKADEPTSIKARLIAVLPEPPSQADLAAAAPRELALQGIFISKQLRTAALIVLPQGDRPLERQNLPVGGQIDGWTVQRIERSSVTLQKGSESKELVMFRGK